MDKVYAIAEGEWDDYNVTGIYSTLEEAVAEVKANWRDYFICVEISEWTLGVSGARVCLFTSSTMDGVEEEELIKGLDDLL